MNDSSAKKNGPLLQVAKQPDRDEEFRGPCCELRKRGVFRTRSIVSEVLSGKLKLNRQHIQRLSQRFHVSPDVFF